jgi:ribonuclease P protein subunit RPR2
MKSEKRVALKRIQILFDLAKKNIHKNPQLSNRYIEIARKVAMRVRLHLPKEYRYYYCKHCKSFNLPGVNKIVRIQPKRSPHIVFTCTTCGKYTRMLINKQNSNNQI